MDGCQTNGTVRWVEEQADAHRKERRDSGNGFKQRTRSEANLGRTVTHTLVRIGQKRAKREEAQRTQQ